MDKQTDEKTTKRKSPKYEVFDSWWEAFDTCRERNRPMVVRVDEDGVTEISKIFPSGRVDVLLMGNLK